jgi:hypothetical protein
LPGLWFSCGVLFSGLPGWRLFRALKCPYGHLRVQDSYWAGGKSKSKIRLIEKWSQQVEQKKGEVKNG